MDGQWSPWVNQGNCTESCGGGVQRRVRQCDNPPPQNGGAECEGVSAESTPCNTQPCGESI